MRRRRLRASGILLVVLVLIGFLASQGGSAGGGSGAHGAVSKPALDMSMTMGRTIAVPGSVPPVPWPATGQSAVAVPGAGLLESSGSETPLPIASLTKMMTAYLTLLEHPLTATSPGPDITLTEADQQEYAEDTVQDASSVEVRAGEVLTERQLLSGMIVRSANNLADTAARWDAGSIPAFVVRMNAEAASLGMTSTHYTGTNGLDADTVSTAHDELLLATHALELPSFASIVDLPKVTLPVAGTIYNYVSAVGTDGVIGIKSGFTEAAMACVVLAAVRRVGGQNVTILAADLAQPDGLNYAAQEDISMIDAAASGLRPVSVASAHEVVAKLYVPGGHSKAASRSVEVETVASLASLAWPGTDVVISISKDKISKSVSAGEVVGTLDASSAGGTPVSVPLVAVASLHQ
jgi:D-alanyl-D-alanine carboxypeptidase (penicillin-binding protein 5/6)